jgi:protein transport protein SEC61 subunit gamma and related proteins
LIKMEITYMQKLRNFWTECMRVLRVTKKPDRLEFTTIVKVSALGMAIIGLIGFSIQMLWEVFK